MTWRRPDTWFLGRSTWVMSPVTTALDPKPMRVRNIFICSTLVFWASSRMLKLSLRERPRMKAIRRNTVVFGIGPAGTGKTYLAMAMAVGALVDGKVNRIILCRPAVEAGERLGFLPGDLTQKVDPYLRPMYDALYEMLGFDRAARHVERQVIEVAPLAFMRCRSLNDSFIILDEAQNTTVEQMKMFLTRIGFGSKAVVTGDITQIDLPRQQRSGLRHVIEVLRDVQGVAFTFFNARDVVRHPLVQRIVQAYERQSDEPEPAA